MGELMQEALGVGLAATQVGVLHRVLVYKAYEDDPVSALVNPVLEWESEEREVKEEGCLSLPGVHVEVERAGAREGARAGHARQGADGRGGGPAGTRDPARDGPPRRGADPRSDLARGAPGCDARVAGGAGSRGWVSTTGRRAVDGPGRPRIGRSARCAPVFLGTSDFAAAVLERLAASGHRPRLALTRPDRPRGRGRRLAAPPVAQAARALGIALEQPRADQRSRGVRAGAGCRGGGGGAGGVRLRGADQGAAAVGVRAAERAPFAAAALAWGGAGRAGDHGG